MEPDKGIENVRKSRKKISAENDFDIHKLVRFYQKNSRTIKID